MGAYAGIPAQRSCGKKRRESKAARGTVVRESLQGSSFVLTFKLLTAMFNSISVCSFTPRKRTLGNEQIDITLIPSKAVSQSRGYLTTGITFQRVHCLLTLSNQGPVFGTWSSWGHVHIPREALVFIIYTLSFLKCHGQGCPKNSVPFFSSFDWIISSDLSESTHCFFCLPKLAVFSFLLLLA